LRLPRADTVEYLAFLLLSTVLAVVFAIAWGLSPLGFGFAPGPADPIIRKMAVGIIMATYLVGLPALLLGQIASPVLWLCGRTRGAYIVPLACMTSFLLGAGVAAFVYGL
jgi:hypothetical protein